MAIDFCSRLESDFNVTASLVTGPEFRSICRQWLETFCQNVKRNTGRWVYHGFRWHAYSFNHEPALSGIRAFEEYQSATVQPFFIFHETDDRLFACNTERWPDLRSIQGDIYLFPHTMEWTFITTHEMSFGPYFALSRKDEDHG